MEEVGESSPEDLFSFQIESQNSIYSVIESILSCCFSRIQEKAILSDIKRVSSQIFMEEIKTNAIFSSFHLGSPLSSVMLDEDLELPPPDSWSCGIITIRDPDTVEIRSDVLVKRDFAPATKRNVEISHKVEISKKILQKTQSQLLNSTRFKPRVAKPDAIHDKSMCTPAQALTKSIDATRKQQSSMAKNITVDSEFNVIPIVEPKSLNGLIVPKVATKKLRNDDSSQPSRRKGYQISKQKATKSRKANVALISSDAPTFDEDAPEFTTDKVIPSNGVTIKEGSYIKSKPKIDKEEKMTKQQYEAYIHELQKPNK